MITSWPLKVASASGVPPYKIDRHQPALHESSKVKSRHHILTVVSYLNDGYSLRTQRACDRPPPSTPPISLDHGLQLHLPTCSITASKSIYELHDPGVEMDLQIRSITASKCISVFNLISASKCISKLARVLPSKCISQFPQSWHPSASPNSTDYGVKDHTVTASKCILKLDRLRPASASLCSLDHGLPVHLQPRFITASKFISLFTQ